MDGTRLKEIRTNTLNMTQQQLADALGVSQALVSQMERGTQAISRRTTNHVELLRREVVRRDHYIQTADTLGADPDELDEEL